MTAIKQCSGQKTVVFMNSQQLGHYAEYLYKNYLRQAKSQCGVLEDGCPFLRTYLQLKLLGKSMSVFFKVLWSRLW